MRLLMMLLFAAAAAMSAHAQDAPMLVESSPVDEAPQAPDHEAWGSAPGFQLPLQKQNFVPPMGGGAVAELAVQALHDAGRVSFRLSWKDSTKNETIDLSNHFVDGCALQLPLNLDDQPTFMMGHQGARVNVWRWKALNQDGERYPKNYADDFYREAALPNSLPGYLGSFEHLVAEGFGTLTRCKEQPLAGAAGWRKGEWSVVISRALGSEEGAVLSPGRQTQIAFAVWDGEVKERNGMKSLTQWLRLLLKER